MFTFDYLNSASFDFMPDANDGSKDRENIDIFKTL